MSARCLREEEIIDTTHLRAAAGACALSIGLLVCSSGGAIALADQTDTGGGTSGTETAATVNDGATTKKGPPSLREAFAAIREAFSINHGKTRSTSTLDKTIFINERGDEEKPVEGATDATVVETDADLPSGQGPISTQEARTNTSGDDQDPTNVVTLDTDEVGTEALPGSVVSTPVVDAATTILDALTPSTAPAAAPLDPNITPPEPGDPAESGGAAALAAGVAGGSGSPTTTTAGQPPGSIQTAVVEPLSNAAMTVVRAFGAAGLTLASLADSQTPITDVITAVQMVLSAVVDAVGQVAQVPNNLLDLLGFPESDNSQSLVGAGGSTGTVVGAPVDAPLIGGETMQLPRIAADAPLFGNVVNASEFGGMAPVSLNHEFAPSGVAPAPASVSPATASFLDNVVRSVQVPASLTALAAIAIPGIAGLLIVCAAGVRVGYRQAKAGLALRVAGIARFAGPGPMGIVRAGSLIKLHSPRIGKPDKPAAHAKTAVASKTAETPRVLESVA